jgi:hypothetical protein
MWGADADVFISTFCTAGRAQLEEIKTIYEERYTMPLED